MNLLIAGGCGFVSGRICRPFLAARAGLAITGLDSLRRRGSETTLADLEQRGVRVVHGDIRATAGTPPGPRRASSRRSPTMPNDIPAGSTAAAAEPAVSGEPRVPAMQLAAASPRPLQKLSVVIPARDEEHCVASTVDQLHLELARQAVPHEIVVVDDGSTDTTWRLLEEAAARLPELTPVRNTPPYGFGRAIQRGLATFTGDAVVIMMADGSDDARDVVRYWWTLQEGWDCVFGSRFIKGGRVIDYPRVKLLLNRLANWFVKLLFRIRLNDTTNAFKAYRREVIEGCLPILSPHFNITVELPLKAIVRGYTWTVIPISWRNRRTGIAKFKIREMGSRYFFIVAYVWLEKYFSRGDYRRADPPAGHAAEERS